MSEEGPMDLRALGDVESPEVVREAVRRFRKRFIKALAWVLLGVVAIGSTLAARSIHESLSTRIDQAPGVAPGAVYQVEGMTAILVKVADLGEQTGFHVLVAQRGTGPQHSTGRDIYELNPPGGSFTDPTGHEDPVYDLWFSLDMPADGRITLGVELQCTPLPEQFNRNGSGSCHIRPPYPTLAPMVIDLPALGVPSEIWKTGGSR